MRYFALVFCLVATHVSATAPFGIKWGESISNYGTVKMAMDNAILEVTSLPKNHSQALEYRLEEIASKGIQKVSMKTELYNKEGESLFNELRHALSTSGYQLENYYQGTLNSYKCLLQANCSGDKWIGIDALGDSVTVNILAPGSERTKGYIIIEFQSSIYNFLKEQDKMEALALIKSIKVRDEHAFGSKSDIAVKGSKIDEFSIVELLKQQDARVLNPKSGS